MRSLFKKFTHLGQRPTDSSEERLRKSGFMVVSALCIGSTIIWTAFNFLFGLFQAGMVTLIGTMLWSANIIFFSLSKRFTAFCNIQLALLLLIGLSCHITMGGFIPSGAVLIWAMIAPAGALIFLNIRKAMWWFLAFVGVVILAATINTQLAEITDWRPSAQVSLVLFAMNIIGISSLIFLSQYYFVGQITALNKKVELKNDILRLQSGKLKEMDKVKSRFFANISHEFRTPLTLILGLVDKLKSRPGLSKEDRRDTNTMKKNAGRLLQLINQLLDLSRIEAGGLKLQASHGDLLLFSKNLASQFESLAAARNIAITFNEVPIDQPMVANPLLLYFDQEKMQKIITNLLSNAVKFTPAGGKIAVEVLREKHDQKDLAVVKVSNTGEGIPHEKLPFVFERFYQVEGDSNRPYEGSGIGLALVKELVELHQGKVSVESTLGVTCFRVELQLNSDYLRDDQKTTGVVMPESLEVDMAKAPLIDSLEEINESHGGNGHLEAAKTEEAFAENELEILIVEDNSDLRSFIGDILARKHQVSQAVDGLDGLEKAEAGIPDLIISDVMMPRMDGYELCRRLKTNDKTNHIPLILLTAKATRENKLEGLETGADDYLVKPFDEEELQLRVRNLLTMRARLQDKFQRESWLRPVQVKASSVQQQFLNRLKEVVEKNIDNESFSIEDLGEAMAMSRSQIHRKLKALTNQSASNFIRNYRLHRAADLLQQNAGNITEVAYQVGFSSQSYFSSSFAAHFGCSPSEYRQKAHGDEYETR